MAFDVAQLANRILDSDGNDTPTREEADALCDSSATELDDLLYWADKIRAKFRSNKVSCCSIISVKTGACSEDCSFCSQASRFKTGIDAHGFLPDKDIKKAAQEAKESGSYALGIVAAGYGPKEKEEQQLLDYIETTKAEGVEAHLNVGILSKDQVEKFKNAGMTTCGHNLETSRRFFDNVCTTHSYDERLETLRHLKDAGVRICSGGIFGLGESWSDRIDLAMELKDLDVANVPLNFLHRITGTPLASIASMKPKEILRVVCLYRFLLPKADIGVYGGREVNLRDLQALVFKAGASALMLGNYLTTSGRDADEDRKMLDDLDLEIAADHEIAAPTAGQPVDVA